MEPVYREVPNECPYCGSGINEDMDKRSLHCYSIVYRCGFELVGAYGHEELYEDKECKNEKNVHIST